MRILPGLLATALLTLAASAHAQSYPNRPIRVVVPFPPGGGTDTVAREAAQRVALATGWTLVIENKPGAGGNIGVDQVAKSTPDGYTLVLGQTSNLSINPTLYARLPYNPQTDLAPITLIAKAPLLMVTGIGTSVKSLKQAIEQGKAKPGVLNFASPGNGTVAHLASESFQRAAGLKFLHIPYKGAAQAMTDVVGGTVELYMSSVPTLLGQVRQGKLRPLAVTSTERIPDLPDVPTIAESGYPGFEATTWYGFLAPAGTPAPIIERLSQEFNKALQTPEMRRKLAEEGAQPGGGSPADFAKLIRDETERWAVVVKASGARVD